MKSHDEVKDEFKQNERELTIEDMLPVCPFSSDTIIDLTNPIIASDGNFYEEEDFDSWVEDGDRPSPLNPNIQLSAQKKIPANLIKSNFQDLVNSYKKLENERNELLQKLSPIKSLLNIKIPNFFQQELQNLLQLSESIEQKKREQAAAFFTKKILIRNVLRKESALKIDWDQFKNLREDLKLQYQTQNQYYSEIIAALVKNISPSLNASQKDNSFLQMDKMINEWKLVRQSYFKEINILINLRAHLMRKTLGAAYVIENKNNVNDFIDNFSETMNENREEKNMQLDVRIKKFISEKFSERSYEKRWERLNNLIQKNADELKKLKQEEIRQNVILNGKLQEELLHSSVLFGGEKEMKKHLPKFELHVPSKDNHHDSKKLSKSNKGKLFKPSGKRGKKSNLNEARRPPAFAPRELNGGR